MRYAPRTNGSGNRNHGHTVLPGKGAPNGWFTMNQITYDLLTKICEKCGGRCCYYAKPPLTEERISILLDHGMTFDDILFQSYRKLDTKSTGFCVGFRDGKCKVQGVKPETCVAGPFTFDVRNDKLEIYLKKERLCDLVAFLKNNPEVYQEQYDLALQSICHLVKTLPSEELAEVLKVEESDTDLVGEVPLSEVLSPDSRN